MDTVKQKVNDFFASHRLRNYKKGEILIRADENPSGIFYLLKGNVKEYAISKKGEEIIVNIFKPGAFFPMSWAINETDNLYYYEATNETAVFKAEKNEVLDFVKSSPDILFDLLSRVYKGTDGFIIRLVYMMSESAYDRLIAELIIHTQRFGRKIKNDTYEVEISEKELAALTGMTRETVSRSINKLKEKNLIKLTKSTLHIYHLNALQTELSTNN